MPQGIEFNSLRGDLIMSKRGLIGAVIAVALAFFLFKGITASRADDTATLQPATFDTVLKTIQTDSKDVDKVVFIKDPNGTVQEVELDFKGTGKHPLNAQVPGDAGTTQLVNAAGQAGVTIDARKTEPASGGFIWNLLSIFGPILLMVFLFQFMFKGMMGGGKGGLGNVTNSKVNEIAPDQDRKTFADVAGCEEAKEELQDVIAYLKDPGILATLGGHPYKGVLLIGGPGNGKTLLAKACAGEANAAFFSISASQFVEMFVGVGAARVRDMFDKARAKKPAIVFIDELDAVGRQRGTGLGGGNDEREQTLNQLLVEMDGFTVNDGILLMAATNRPDVLDPALTRPGRFGDLQVLVDNANHKGRKDILTIHTRKKKVATDVNLDVIASNTPGFSGAELEGVTNHGAFVAARRIAKMKAELRAKGVSEAEIAKQVTIEISMADLDEGIDRVQMGPAKEDALEHMTLEEKMNTDYHELGHAWVSQDRFERGLGGDPVTKITIVPRARALGYTMALPRGDRSNMTIENMKSRIMMAMGGRAAQEIFLGVVDTGAQNDFKQAKSLAYRMVTEFGMSNLGPIFIGEGGGNPFLGRSMATDHQVGPALLDKIDAEWTRIVNECYTETRALIERDKACFDKIAKLLLEKKTILGPEFMQLRADSDCAVKPCIPCGDEPEAPAKAEGEADGQPKA